MPRPRADMRRRFGNRFGDMQLVSTGHTYPLVGVYVRHFIAPRFAPIGNAAAGMHPVTAHGFHLGLRGSDTPASLISHAARPRRPAASQPALASVRQAIAQVLATESHNAFSRYRHRA